VKLSLQIEVAPPPSAVWKAMGDVPLIAACVPGAALTGVTADGAYTGRVTAKVGPVGTSFSGEASLARDDAAQTGRVTGKGRDSLTGSGAKAELFYHVAPATASGDTLLEIACDISLSGILAQFGKAAVINDVAGRIAREFAANLSQRLNAEPALRATEPPSAAPIRAEALLKGIVMARLEGFIGWIRRLFGFRKGATKR
jgi:carbon-monoxide dehydrogenase small subunit